MQETIFYICPTCFQVCDTPKQGHTHRMLKCRAGDWDDPRRKPVRDRFGNLVSRAPRWYLEAVIPSWAPVESLKK